MIRDSRTARLAVGCVLAVAAAVAMAAGARPFGVLVALLAAAILVEVSAMMGRDGARPVLPAAAIPALGLPLAAAFAPEGTWERLPVFLVGMLLAGFVLLLVGGRRHRVTEALAGTCLAGTVIGLGAGSLVLLRVVPGGFAWVLATLLLAAVPAAVMWAARELAGQPARIAAAAAVVAVGIVAGVLIAVYDAALSPTVIVGLAAIGWAAGVLGRALQLRGAEPAGLLLPLLGGCLLAAPVAYVLARIVG